ncbi:diguanylate cyclase domain-containing protein [Shewanella sp. SR44-3]|uniref:diguanylate cyclase domain-containing protein n=1 Tax=unclassified Shewanella TaxID=196818 RepID=UPI0015F94655|nr:diguanylate cyclase [Shewanella sp. SR44-3]MBB1269073.1 diguanylate cyclase [Shewanella sp. SR44-3]
MSSSEKLKQLEEIILRLEAENKALKLNLQFTQEKLHAALDGTGLCLWEQDIPTGNLTIHNQQWGDLLGFTIEELPAHIDSWKGNLHPDDKEWVIAAFDEHVAGKTDIYQAVHRMIHKDGSITWVSDRGRITSYTPEGKPLKIIGTHVDITQEKRYEQSLAKLAHYDPLTDLLNRAAIEQSYLRLQSQALNGSLCFIDLDGLKVTNDKHGHHIGDLLLIHVAKTLTQYSIEFVSQHQGIDRSIKIARLGGDEFVLLIATQDQHLLKEFCQSLIDHYQQAINLEGKKITIGLSIGVYRFTAQDNFATSCEMADTAMYFVKKRGKNNIAFWQESLQLA